MNALQDVVLIIVQTISSVALVILSLRLLAQAAQVNSYNAVATGLMRATAPLIAPFQPVLGRRRGRINLPTVASLLCLQTASILSIVALYGALPAIDPLALIGWVLLGLLGLFCSIIFYALLAMIIISFIASNSRHPAVEFIWELTEPLMTPVRTIIPTMGGLDFSPILVFLGLQIVQSVIGNAAIAIDAPPWVIGL